MADESIQERQDNELEALKAIYGDQLHETHQEGNGWQPLEVVLVLGPQQGSVLQEAHTFVHLHVACTHSYPNEVPKMTIEKSKGLTTQQLNTLLSNLYIKADSMKGEEMVFDLASIVETFLHQYNKPGFQSLYDEMFSRQLKKQQKEEEEKKVLENQTRQEVLMEIQNKKEALKQEMRWRKNSDAVKEEDDLLSRVESTQTPAVKRCLLTADLLDSGNSNEMKQNGTDDFSSWTVSPKGVSRLDNEFEVLQFVGKGAFGDVLKVRNKLDRCLYAIKRIELNPMNKLLYKKITREVKLLSRLNHENVVRYYGSWIESTSLADSSSPSAIEKPRVELACQAVNMLPMAEASVGWDLSQRRSEHSNDSDSDSDDDNCWITFLSDLYEMSYSRPGSSESASNNDTSNTEKQSNDSPLESRTVSVVSSAQQFMYIQMEFCEKSTLRSAIDNGLYMEEKRVWRLLREIVEGLSHIHQQGIIHRDLKPVNVFIDSEDHVKIGDFGLATTNILSKTGMVLEQSEPVFSQGDISHTGQVGTALYVAPELNTSSLKAIYNQRVDIYSLGVMFFEMCYRPLETHMERIKVLADLRTEDCVLPADFVDTKHTKTKILRWMLSHDPLLRPSSEELLQSDLLPPPQLEECELQELLRRTINNPQSKLYKCLIATCFTQKMTTAQDVTYDMSVSKGRCFISLLQEVTEKIRKVAELHGAVSLSPPLLVPHGCCALPSSAVCVMTRWGGVATLPHDLRLSFARFLAHNPSVTLLKRYSVDRVYRERRVLGHHPRELYECAFDIVTPASAVGSVLADAELLSFVWQVLSECPSQLQNSCVLRLNHTSLLRAIFLHCGIETSKHSRVCSLLAQAKLEESFNKSQLVGELELSEHTVSSLLSLLDQESSFNRVSATLLTTLKRNSNTQALAMQAFSQLQLVINCAQGLGVRWPVVVTPGLVNDLTLYSGVVCQLVWETRDKHGRCQRTIVAAGGRYDYLINNLRQVPEEGLQSACGISLSLDKLVGWLQTQADPRPRQVNAVVCSVGPGTFGQDKLTLARDLWAAGVNTYLLDTAQNLEEVQNFCLEMNVSHLIMLKDSDPGYVRIRSWNKDRFQEKRVVQAECVEQVQRLSQPQTTDSRPEAKTMPTPDAPSSVNTVFLIGEKLSSAMRRRYESQIISSITSTIQRLSSKVRVEVIVLNVEAEAIRYMAAYINLDYEDQDLSAVTKRFPKHKKAVIRLTEHLQDLTSNSAPTAVVLYSIVDNMFKVLL